MQEPLVSTNTIRTENAVIRLIDDNIFYVLYDPEIVIEVSDFEETRSVYEKLSENQLLKFIVEFPPYTSATADARKWATEHQVDALAEAIVFHGLAQRLLIRFYLRFRKQKHQVKIFNCNEEALNWLRSYSP